MSVSKTPFYYVKLTADGEAVMICEEGVESEGYGIMFRADMNPAWPKHFCLNEKYLMEYAIRRTPEEAIKVTRYRIAPFCRPQSGRRAVNRSILHYREALNALAASVEKGKTT